MWMKCLLRVVHGRKPMVYSPLSIKLALTMGYGPLTMQTTHKPDRRPYKWVKRWQHRVLRSIQDLFQDHRKPVYANV